MGIRLKNKTAIDHVLWVIPSVFLAYTMYQGYCVRYWSFATMSLWRFLFFFTVAAVITALPLLIVGRRVRPWIPSDLALVIAVFLLYFAIFPRSGWVQMTINVLNDLYMPYKSVHMYALFLLPLCYLLLLSLRCTLGPVLSRRWWEYSLCARVSHFLGRGKTLRRKLLIEIAAIQVLVGALSALCWLIAGTLNLFQVLPDGLLWSGVILLPVIMESVALFRVFLSSRSAGTDIECIADAIRDSAQGHFPEENPVPQTSPLFETGEALMELGRLTEDGIRRGIAGEKLKVELITNVSHDLRTPLTSIIGYGEQLERAELPEEAAETARKLTRKAKYLSEMVNDLFDLSKTASGAMRQETCALDLHRLIEQTVGEMDDRITSSGFTFVTDLAAAQTQIVADGVRLHRVVQNLIDNALKYSLAGTRIFLSTCHRDGEVVLSILNTAAYPLAQVTDPETLTERFRRGDESRTGEGSGLGLAIAKTYTEAAGGRFDIVIRGDTFEAIVTLPVAEETVRESTEKEQ